MVLLYVVVEPRSIVIDTVAFCPVDTPLSSPLLYWWSKVYVSLALPPSLIIGLSTEAFSTILVVLASPPPPPLPAGMSTAAISAPLLFLSARRTVLSSSLTSALISNTVAASTSLNLAVTVLFCTGLVLLASRVSSTSCSSITIFTLPSASGVMVCPFTLICLIFPPPYSSQLATVRKFSIEEAQKR